MKWVGASLLALLLAGCGGGTGETGSGAPSPVSGGTPGGGAVTPAVPTSVFAKPAAEALTTADVQSVIARAVGEAQARGLPVVVAVVDRVGNVLAVYRMNGARPMARARPGGAAGSLDVQNVEFRAELAAIAKAITGAYLSSGGNAFSTRTASMIVQEHFPPSANTRGLESGPLFGEQFSQLPCSDLNTRFGVGSPMLGPKRSPLGLAADAGRFPLYKNGVVVGGVGVMGDGDYGFDPEVVDIDVDDEEVIALAGTTAFPAPETVRAERISVDGTLLRYSDAKAEG
ncbi:heme-binding protein, partial [Polymorphobacter multimanifer]|uniref:heme-binding protein n=1 Tax=Polymorphobacter multimanifer TaxID=1070431 RepID=UPI001666DA75